jgi:molybdopterin-guanine dinucleotide biosynthesis protein B
VTPAVVAFVGHSGSGKTTLLEGVLRDLVGRGLRVGTVKHDPKGHAAYDHPGKDSWRHRRAGAAVVALAGPATVATFRDAAGDESLPALARRLAADTPLDLVLAEGYHTQCGFAKVEVYRPSLGRPPRCAAEELLAVAAATPHLPAALAGLPRLPLDDPRAVARFLLEHLLPERRVSPPPPVPGAAG